MPQALERLKIKNEDTNEEFSVLFNPSEYTIDDSSKWSDQEHLGQTPELQYTGGSRKKLTLDLFFDTYENRTDVREHTGKIAKLLEFNKEKHRPPKVTLSWGKTPPNGVPADFPFTAVLESLKQHFILFMGDGTPVRAKLTVTFVQFILPGEKFKKNAPQSSDHTKTYIVKVGDTLSGIAGLFYRDPRKWRPIAYVNDIRDPGELEPGQELLIPRIE